MAVSEATHAHSAAHALPEAQACAAPLQRITLAGLQWRAAEPAGAPAICLHGWLDNACSFSILGSRLGTKRTVTSFDLPGHGLSGARPQGYPYHMLDYVQDLAELLEAQPGPVHLIGHSLGGILAALLAATDPKKLQSLTMIDSLGPYVAKAEDFPVRLKKGIQKALVRERGAMPVYDSVKSAEQARQSGMLPLSAFAAAQLVPRNLREVEGGWSWRTDRRLRNPSLSALTEEQVLACLAAIEVPVLLVRAENGMLAADERFKRRTAAVRRLSVENVSGSHHCHIDGDVESITTSIEQFMLQTDPVS